MFVYACVSTIFVKAKYPPATHFLSAKLGFEIDSLEKIAELEHKQWQNWAQSVFNEVSEDRKAKWKKYFVEYNQLPEEVKEKDRDYARKVLEEVYQYLS